MGQGVTGARGKSGTEQRRRGQRGGDAGGRVGQKKRGWDRDRVEL